jgi:phosphonate transport system substrate-binding protein
MNVSVVASTMVIIALATGGCSTLGFAHPNTQVDLALSEPLPEIGVIEQKPLRIAIGAVLSPEGTVESYAGLAEYLGDQLDRPVELVQRRTYAEINELVEANAVDLAFVCTSAYVAGHDRDAMDLLVVPEIDGETVYRSVIIVPASSRAENLEDLRGGTFAFTDPMSHTGRVYPTYALLQQGETPEEFFDEMMFTYGHDRSIQAVAAQIVDGAAVDNLVLVHMLKRDPSLVDKIRVISTSPPFGIPPVVVPSSTPASVRALFTRLLIDLEFEPEGPMILASLGVDRFVLGSDGAYDGVRLMVNETGLGS